MPNTVLQIVEVAGKEKDIRAFQAAVCTQGTKDYNFAFDCYRIAEDSKLDTWRQMKSFSLFGGLNIYLDMGQTNDLIHNHKNKWKEERVGPYVKISTVLFIAWKRLPSPFFDFIAKKHPNLAIASHWDTEFSGGFGRGLWLKGECQYCDDFEGPSHIDAVSAFHSTLE